MTPACIGLPVSREYQDGRQTYQESIKMQVWAVYIQTTPRVQLRGGWLVVKQRNGYGVTLFSAGT